MLALRPRGIAMQRSAETPAHRSEPRALARDRIRRTATRLRRATSPTLLVACLVGAALTPAVLPMLGVAAGTSAVEALRALLGPVSGSGQSLINDFVKRFISTCGPCDEDELQDRLETALADELTSGPDAAALRGELAALVESVGGVEAALTAVSADLQANLAERFLELGARFDEFQFALTDASRTLQLVLSHAREQLDLQRDVVTKVNYLVATISHRDRDVTPHGAGDVELVIDLTDDVREPVPPEPAPDARCPYLGLTTFQPEDADRFFGRERLVAELLGRVGERDVLVVIGPSGSGKSSLVRAGLLPAAALDPVEGSGTEWLVMTPGERPLEELAYRVPLRAGLGDTELLRRLEDDPRALRTALRELLDGRPGTTRLLLVIDQFEEIFTLCRDEAERSRFVAALVSLLDATDRRLALVLAIRADFYGHCAAYPDLVARMQDDQVLVGAMSPDELRAAIERPAAAAGFELEAGLADLVVEDAASEPGALPLVSHALVETWRRRRGRSLTVAGYLEAGGVRGAIAKTAESLFSEGFGPDERAIARDILLRLTELGDTTEPTRRRARLTELRTGDDATVGAVLEALAGGRLVTVGDGSVEVAHEALIREWPRLRSWLSEDRERLEVLRHLRAAAEEWDRNGRDRGYLYRGARLGIARELAAASRERLSPVEQAFLEASQLLEEDELREARRRVRRTRALAATMGVLAVLAGVLALQTRSQQQRALSRQLAAQASQEAWSGSLEVALLLAVQAYRTEATPEAEAALQSALTRTTYETRTFDLGTPATTVAFSPDGRFVAAGGAAPYVRLWDLDDGGAETTIEIDADGVASIAFSPAGEHVVIGTNDGNVVLRGTSAGGSETSFDLHEGWVSSVAFDPSGQRLATAGQDGSVHLVDTRSQEVAPVPVVLDGSWATDVTFSPDGSLLVVATSAMDAAEGTLEVWDVAANEGRHAPYGRNGAGAVRLAMHPDGTQVAAGWTDGVVSMLDLATGAELPGTGQVSFTAISGLAFSAEGSRLVSGSQDGQVQFHDLDTGFRQPLPAHHGQVMRVATHPSRPLVATASWDTSIHLSDLDRRSFLGETLAQHGYIAAVPGDGPELAGLRRDGTVEMWDVGRRATFGSFQVGDPGMVSALHLSADASTVVVGEGPYSPFSAPPLGTRYGASIWRTADGTRVATLRTDDDESLSSVALNRDGTRLATTDSLLRRVSIWDTATGTRLRTLEGYDGRVTFARFSADDAHVIGGTNKGVLHLWEASTGDHVREFTTHGASPIGFIATSSDGGRIAATHADQQVTVWDLATGDQVGRPLRGHTSQIWWAAFDADGGRLATAASSPDGSVRLWDVATGEPQGSPLWGHLSGARMAFFTPDETELVTVGVDDTILLWDLSPDRWVERACELAGRNLTPEEWSRYVGAGAPRPSCPSQR
jgi:WD40 repeat protein